MPSLTGRLLVEGAFRAGTVHFDAGRITRVEQAEPQHAAELPWIGPGLIDLHVHGHGGHDPLEDLGGLARSLARAGTTAFQPTLFPAAPRVLGAQCAALEAQRERPAVPGAARVVGLHLEGPFVNPAAAGALPVADLALPSRAALAEILGPASGSGRWVRTLTLAPELAGAAELVDELARLGVRVSLGHSRATAAEARAAARSGACGATHLFNAMAPLHHREVGLAGFALSGDALFAEIIGDLVHVGPDMFALALRARGPAGLCLVSDALRGAGTGCERFHAHGREHLLRDGAAWYPPATAEGAPRLAGSALSQLEMVRRLVERGVVSLAEAWTMASTSPARALGLERERGLLQVGLAADLLVLEPRTLALREVRIAGETLAA